MPQRPLSSRATRMIAPRRIRVRRRLVAQRGCSETKSVSRNLHRLPVGHHRPHLGGRRIEDDGRRQAVTFRRILEDPLEDGVALAGVVGQAHVGLGSPVTVPPVVVDCAAAQRSVSDLLVILADGGLDGQALGVGVLAIGVENDLPGHLGDVLGMGRDDFAEALPNGKWRVLCFTELVVGDEP